MDINKKMAMDEINEKLQRVRYTDEEGLLINHRLNQKVDFERINSKVVFDEKTSTKLLSMIAKMLDTDYVEYGTYFYGYLSGNTIYINDSLSDFKSSTGVYLGAAINVTEQNVIELNSKIEKSLNARPCNVVMHFHTHPDYVIDKYGDIIKAIPLLMSEQDLYCYGFQQLYMQPTSKNSVIYIGCMAAKNNNKPQISTVIYDPNKMCFYYIDNIFLTHNGQILKVNSDDLTTHKEISLKEKAEIKLSLLKLKMSHN